MTIGKVETGHSVVRRLPDTGGSPALVILPAKAYSARWYRGFLELAARIRHMPRRVDPVRVPARSHL